MEIFLFVVLYYAIGMLVAAAGVCFDVIRLPGRYADKPDQFLVWIGLTLWPFLFVMFSLGMIVSFPGDIIRALAGVCLRVKQKRQAKRTQQ